MYITAYSHGFNASCHPTCMAHAVVEQAGVAVDLCNRDAKMFMASGADVLVVCADTVV